MGEKCIAAAVASVCVLRKKKKGGLPLLGLLRF